MCNFGLTRRLRLLERVREISHGMLNHECQSKCIQCQCSISEEFLGFSLSFQTLLQLLYHSQPEGDTN